MTGRMKLEIQRREAVRKLRLHTHKTPVPSSRSPESQPQPLQSPGVLLETETALVHEQESSMFKLQPKKIRTSHQASTWKARSPRSSLPPRQIAPPRFWVSPSPTSHHPHTPFFSSQTPPPDPSTCPHPAPTRPPSRRIGLPLALWMISSARATLGLRPLRRSKSSMSSALWFLEVHPLARARPERNPQS